jgi:hypothetical protein
MTGYRCFMWRLRQDDPDLAEQAQRGIDSKHPSNLVAMWLQDHGVRISDQAIRTHRLGQCMTCRRQTS